MRRLRRTHPRRRGSRREPTRPWSRPARLVALAAAITAAVTGVVVADTLTRPHDVHLRTRIEIYQEVEEGDWEKIDEVGPENLRFEASLLDVARGSQVGTDFVFQARTKQGKSYSVRLAGPAHVSFNPATGRSDGDMAFEVTYDGATARVLARPTTETRFGPDGSLRGRRGQGVLGRGPVSFAVVSVNELELPGRSPMMLVTHEEYRMTPRGDE